MLKPCLTLSLCALLLGPFARADLAFSCADNYSNELHKAAITGTILEGFGKYAFNVKAEISSIRLFDDEKQTLEDSDVELHGEGFVSATGSHQFDLDSNRKVGKGFVSFQISLKNRSNPVYSYLTLNNVKYRTICAVAKPARFTKR
ncbi:MAG: hypothetical protein JST80_13625 [Bdellovibrionales bacterium]|nr:hypothetical protein [Bdellovibrionales bacterium]